MPEDKTLLIRNLRGNWSARFLHEYFYRHKAESSFYYLNLIKLEVFPPHKSAPTFINAKFREWITSQTCFKNPYPQAIEASLKQSDVQFVNSSAIFSLRIYLIILSLFRVTNSQELDAFKVGDVPFGKFLHTTLISKYGVKHFDVTYLDHVLNFRLYRRFFYSYIKLSKTMNDLSITKIVLVNGRDIVGVAAQLCGFLKHVPIVTLEAGFGEASVPLYGEWNGNMHHWRVRQNELSKTVARFPDYEGADEFIKKKYGHGSRWWKIGSTISSSKIELPENFVCFFTTSERESTCCPTGNPADNFFDEFDQVTQLLKVYKFAKSRNLPLIIRIHPNFSNSKSAKNELRFFENLTSEWEETTLIPNNSDLDSYSIANQAKFIFTFRSSLSAEFSRLQIHCIQTAPTAWSQFSFETVKTTDDQIMSVNTPPRRPKTAGRLDWEAFAIYYALHGKNFESVSFVKVEIGSREKTVVLLEKLHGNLLDIPRFNKFPSRN